MPKITKYYGIRTSVEFLDVNVSRDNRMYIDPRAVRLERGPRPYVGQANKCTSTFFDTVSECAVSQTKSDQRRGLDLLQHFSEPKETRLGMSLEGIDGHGGAGDVGNAIWRALTTNLRAFVRVGLLKHIEDIPVFVRGVDKDITSDLTTRIIFKPLAKFTQEMVSKYPEFTNGRHRVDSHDFQIWNPRRMRWETESLELPIAESRPLLLVPKHWARPRLLMSSTRYYKTSVLDFAQERTAVVDPSTGELVTTSKKTLQKRPEFATGVETSIKLTADALKLDEDLLDRFRAFVTRKYSQLDDDEIAERITEV